MHLTHILAEVAHPRGSVHSSPVRADWFVQMLSNGIAGAVDHAGFVVRNPRFAIARTDALWTARRRACEAAISALRAAKPA
jgi:hypothetical protein